MHSYPHFYVVILCDDYGSQLWPIARKEAPACLAPAEAGSGTSLLAATVERTRALSNAPLQIVTTQSLASLIENELIFRCKLYADEFELLCLPQWQGSAFSVALVCARIRSMDPDAVVAVFAANHYFHRDDRYDHIIHAAYTLAAQDRIVLFGTKQKHPVSGTAFIRKGKVYDEGNDAFEVRQFSVDAPLNAATRACAEGALWYAQSFVARCALVLGELSRAAESAQTQPACAARRIAETASFLSLLKPTDWLQEDAKAVIAAVPRASYEKAALEVSKRLVVIESTIEITAVNTLIDLARNAAHDAANNYCLGNAYAINSRNTVVYTNDSKRVSVALGLNDCFVIDAPDALLVASRSHLDELSDVFTALRADEIPQLTHTLDRPIAQRQGQGRATLLSADTSYASWRLELNIHSVLDALSVPAQFNIFTESTSSFREQYVVLTGKLTLVSSKEGTLPVTMSAGDAFELDASEHTQLCCPDSSATLILVAVSSPPAPCL